MKENQKDSIHRYFVCHPESVAELWEENLILFRSNPTYRSAKLIWEPVSHKLTLEHPFFLLSCLPNFHKWKCDKHVNITRFCQRSQIHADFIQIHHATKEFRHFSSEKNLIQSLNHV